MEQSRSPVFLSYTTDNSNMMLEIAAYLEDRGIPCWYAPRNILPGDEYDLKIAVDIETKVGTVVVLITEEVAQSKFVPKEIALANKYGKKVIPLIIDRAPIPKNLEFRLENIHWVDVSIYENEEEALDYLVELLELAYTAEEAEAFVPDTVRRPVVLKQQTNSSLFTLDMSVPMKTRTVFEFPPSFSSIEGKLRKNHYLYLYNPHHVGKYTAAVALLDKIGIDDIYEWSKEATIKQIISHPIKKNAGFIIDIDTPEYFFNYISDHEIERFLSLAVAQGSYIIFLSKEETIKEALQTVSVKLNAPKESQQLLMNHVKWQIQDESLSQKIVDWVESDKGKQLLPKEIYPRYAEKYVTKIHQLVLGELTENNFLHSLDTHVFNRVKTWFKQSYTLRDIAFYLNIGLFQGQRYQTIIEKSEELLDYFHQQFGGSEQPYEPIPSRDEYLLRFHAEVRTGWIQTNAGREPIEGVYLIFPQDQTVIWEYLWLQYPSYQAPLVKWIKNLLKNPQRGIDDVIRGLIVHLAKKDSLTVRNHIILPLAKSAHHRERFYAVSILEKLAEDEDFTHMVFTLVKSWALQSNNDRLQWTAILLLGSKVGISYYSKSLRLLRGVFKAENSGRTLSYPIQRSIGQLGWLGLCANEYETLFFGFWNDWFSSLKGEEFMKPLEFAHAIFLSNPKLFFKSSEKWQSVFWKELLRISYVKTATRKSAEALINQWIFSAKGPFEQTKIANLIFLLFLEESVENQERLHNLIDRGLRKDEEQYLPIYKQLITL
ncbi:toll/interleukin-1 receptor domain-containing protein [Gottfriedia acidiceleris]|uniref:toll/interleukin-1 receptor domain-containing protein n=1 Tax=Gottfriedia acidiceleris TaxID=371036 RepID=UPI002FFE7B02